MAPREPPSPASERIAAYRRGLRAEALAAWWLRLKGYRILARRFRTPSGEVDIVARRGGTVAFVEVKRRATLDEALIAVTPRTRRRMEAVVRLWLARHPAHAALTLRFDIIALAPGRLPRHLVSAFAEGE